MLSSENSSFPIRTPSDVEALIADIRRRLASTLRDLESQLGETRYIAADSYSLADVAWTCVLARLKMLGLEPELWGKGDSPRVAAYYELLRQRPSFQQARIWEATPTGKARIDLIR